MHKEIRDIERIDRGKHARVVGDVDDARNADGDEPKQGDGAEHRCNLACPEPLHGEQDREDQQRQRHDVGIEGRGHHFDALDRRKHRDCGRDHRVAEEQRGAENADHEYPDRPAAEAPAHHRDQRQDPALAVVVGAQHEGDVFDGDDDRQRPEDQRQHAENLLGRGRRATGRRMQRLAQRIDRARADVAIDDAERAEHEQRQILLRRMGFARSRLGPSVRSRARDRHFRQQAI